MALAKPGGSLLEEFKNFAVKGNVVDLAVAVVIGAAFGKVIDSLVKHILMPLISIVLPAHRGYLDWKLVINGKDIPYGLFIGEIVNFLLVALAVFLFVVKFLGWLVKTRQAAPPGPTRDQVLLTEIRDILKQKSPV